MKSYYRAWRKSLPFTTVLFLVLTLGFAVWSGFTTPTMICAGFLVLCILLQAITRRISGPAPGRDR